MKSKIGIGVWSGILAGLVFGLQMQMMTAPTPEGGQMPVIGMVAQIVGSESLGVGWIYHLFNSAVIGALFGAFFGNKVRSYGSGFGWGAGYGFAWWILGGLVLMPLFLGMPAFAPLRMPPMRGVAFGSLVGHLVYGAILGLAFYRSIKRASRPDIRGRIGEDRQQRTREKEAVYR